MNDDVFDIPVNSYPIQTQDFDMFGYSLQFTLRYNAVGCSWSFDLYDNRAGEYVVMGEGLSTAQPSLYYSEMPFVIMMIDNYGLGVESISNIEMGDRFGITIMSREAYNNAMGQTNPFNGWQQRYSSSDNL